MTYVVKMNGEKVRSFDNVNILVVSAWARKHCQGEIEIVNLTDCGRLPSASSRRKVNMDMPDLRYKPFEAL